MNSLLKMLDENLEYHDHTLDDNILYITVFSNRKEVRCPFCGTLSSKTHFIYEKSFQDLPIQDKKVTIRLMNRKLFCQNSLCGRKTFAERFEFIWIVNTKLNNFFKGVFTILNWGQIT